MGYEIKLTVMVDVTEGINYPQMYIVWTFNTIYQGGRKN